MTVPRLVIWAQGTAIEDEEAARLQVSNDCVACVIQRLHTRAALVTPCVVCSSFQKDLAGRTSNIQVGVVQKGHLTIRVNYLTEIFGHLLYASRDLGHAPRYLGSISAEQTLDIKHIVENPCVIHRRSLDVSAVRQDLLGYLLSQYLLTHIPPPVAFRSV